MELHTSAFDHGAWIPRIHTGEGEDLSPPLQWRDAPAATVSYALILDDPDAPAGLWIHWVLYDIPASISALPQGLERVDVLAHGARQGRCWGVNHFSRRGYHGPQPPPGPPHRYRFQLSALDSRLDLPAGATAADVRQAMASHVLDQAELIALYQNHSSC
jgi:Raf kinase inhibitor-like YbhB/YbcL family protein